MRFRSCVLGLLVGRSAALMMKSVIGTGIGEDKPVESLIEMGEMPIPKPTDKTMLVRVLACALAPGDVRVLSGQCDRFQAPPTFPYIPGGDICGIVEETNQKFQKGDCVYTLFDDGPRGGMAKYAVVSLENAALKPKTATPIEAAALGSSALTAWWAAKKYVQSGDRVLVLGGTGGVGAHLCQLVKIFGASYVAATTSKNIDESPLSTVIDRVIDYRQGAWADQLEGDPPFDVVFDLVGGKPSWDACRRSGPLCQRSYVTLTGDNPHFEIHSSWQAILVFGAILRRALWSRVLRKLASLFLRITLPTYSYHIGLSTKDNALVQLANLVDDGSLKVIIDPSSPVPFDLDAINGAFRLQKSRHPYGKIVLQIPDAS